MKVNGIDISVYGARQHSVKFGYASLANSSEWQSGDIAPLLLRSAAGFKEITVSIILKGESRQEIWRNGSRLISALLEPGIITLDGFDHKYMVYLKNADQAESSIHRWHKAELTFCGYEFSDQKTAVSTETSFQINCGATLKTPAVLELTPPIGYVSTTVYGLTKNRLNGENMPIIVYNLEKDKTVSIDGETGLITQGGKNKAGDVVLYDLPALEPGINEILTDHEIRTAVKYKERFI